MKRLCTGVTIAAAMLLLAVATRATWDPVLAGFAPASAGLQAAPAASATVTVKNPFDLARPSETISLPAADVQRALSVDNVRKVHVRDAAGRELVAQAIDVDDDGKFEEFIFQADIAPKQTASFTLTAGDMQALKPGDYKAYGRFVRERRDDFAWENDRIAHRMYGAALETWAQEPLTSSAVDVWSKRVPRLVINDWYMVDDYHHDNGTGGDFYSAGKSRGCGGNGVWAGGALYPSANFRGSRVLANGPIRVMFELSYEPWEAGGVKVSEVKRITLDAGWNLDRFESEYRVLGGTPQGGLSQAIGIKKNTGSQSAANRERGVLRTWEPVKGNGNLGCAVIVEPSAITEFTEKDGNYLVVAKVPVKGAVVYHAGFVWDKSGQMADMAEWDRYVEQAARRFASPVEVSLSAK